MLQKVRKMMKNDKGFTLIELMVVIIILGILAAIAIPRFTSKKTEALSARQAADIKILQNAVDLYYFDKGTYPADFDDLTPTYLKEAPTDPEVETPTDKEYKITTGVVTYE